MNIHPSAILPPIDICKFHLTLSAGAILLRSRSAESKQRFIIEVGRQKRYESSITFARFEIRGIGNKSTISPHILRDCFSTCEVLGLPVIRRSQLPDTAHRSFPREHGIRRTIPPYRVRNVYQQRDRTQRKWLAKRRRRRRWRRREEKRETRRWPGPDRRGRNRNLKVAVFSSSFFPTRIDRPPVRGGAWSCS